MSFIKAHMIESLKYHTLTEVPAGEKIQAIWMRKPKTGIYSAMLLFTPIGIVIGGDISLSNDSGGIVSHRGGYDLAWFVDEKMSEDYLCSKFLRRNVWETERAALWCCEQAVESELAQRAHAFRALAANLQSGSVDTPEAFAVELEDLKYEIDDGLPGYGYPSAEAGWLCAIQKRFTELYLMKLVEIRAAQ